MKIVFVALQLSQPRCIKRIKSIYDAEHDIDVYGFDSGLYNESLKSLPFPVKEIIKRDKESGKLSKIIFFSKKVKHILKQYPKDSIFYVFGFELAIFFRLYGCKHYIYEEADVTAARINNHTIQSLMIKVDKSIIKRSDNVVFTSEGFVEYLFPKNAPLNKIILLPNKLSRYFDKDKRNSVVRNSIDVNHIKFGFIGLIRYPNTIIRFAKVIGRSFPQHEFHFFGQPERESFIDDEIKQFGNVLFHGSFKNPDDLQSIYEQIDISIVCYDTQSGNVRIAEPNKLYESIFFKKPLVVSSGTFLAERVCTLGVGYDIDSSSDDLIVDFVNKLSIKRIEECVKNMELISTGELLDNPTELLERVKILKAKICKKARKRFIKLFFLHLQKLPMKSKAWRPTIVKMGGVDVLEPDKTFIGEDVSFDTNYPEDITIYPGVRLTAGVRIVTHFMNPVTNSYDRGKVVIKKNAYLGMNTLVVKPVTIGENAIVGAGSVVTKNIPDNEVWAGNPARFIRKIER